MAMAGSSRTLYQGGVDGWLPKYLAHTNEHGAPTRAMWTDLIFNLGLLTFAASDATAYYLILSISNVGYMLFIFLNLQSTWIHRIDSPNIPRPYRAPNWLVGFNALLGFFNLFLMGVGAKVWGNPNALWYGLLFGLLIIPVFLFRHYVQDKGRFPDRSHLAMHWCVRGSYGDALQRAVFVGVSAQRKSHYSAGSSSPPSGGSGANCVCDAATHFSTRRCRAFIQENR